MVNDCITILHARGKHPRDHDYITRHASINLVLRVTILLVSNTFKGTRDLRWCWPKGSQFWDEKVQPFSHALLRVRGGCIVCITESTFCIFSI